MIGAVYMKAAGQKIVGMDTGVPEWIAQIDTYAQDASLVKDMMRQMDRMVSDVRTRTWPPPFPAFVLGGRVPRRWFHFSQRH